MENKNFSNNFIVDSHCHLDLLEEKGFDIDEIIKESINNNVKIIQTICTRISKINDILKYAQKYENVFASIGNHPCNVDESWIIKAQEIVEICAQHNKIIGIGETGLDYFHKDSEIKNQKNSFLEHIQASQITNLPLIIHSRDADKDMIDILEREQRNKKFPAVLHCFSSTKELAFKAIDLDIAISISGIVTFKNAEELQNIVKNIPLSSLLVETDSPYLAPVPFRGKINQPSYTKNIVEFIANLKNQDPEIIAIKTTENFLNLFNINRVLF